MIFVLFGEIRENLFSTFYGLVGRPIFLEKLSRLAKINLMSLKPNSSLSSAAVLDLKANFFSTQNNTSISGC